MPTVEPVVLRMDHWEELLRQEPLVLQEGPAVLPMLDITTVLVAVPADIPAQAVLEQVNRVRLLHQLALLPEMVGAMAAMVVVVVVQILVLPTMLQAVQEAEVLVYLD
jgi:hypothetical protein